MSLTVSQLKSPLKQNRITFEDMAKMGRKSLYYLAKVILGYSDMSESLHREMARFIQDKKNKRKLILIPRSHFKSSLCTISGSIFDVVNDPNKRILITSNTSTNAQKFLREIGKHFTNNEVFKACYPELVPDLTDRRNKWTESELTIPRTGIFGEATFTAFGVGGGITGNHYDKIVKDDLLDERTNFDGTPIEDIIEWHKYSEGLFNKPSEGEDIIIGTRYHFNDLYQYIIDNEPTYVHYIRKAIENGEPIFPERFTMETLDQIRAKQGPLVFANQYMNDPIPEGDARFKEEDLTYLPYSEFPKDIIKFMLTDTIGDSGGKDFFVTTCWGVEPGSDNTTLNNIYLIDIIAGRLNIDMAVQHCISMFRFQRPVEFGIEKTGQSTFGLHINNFLKQHGSFINITDLSPRGRKKEARIWGLYPYAINKKIFVNSALRDTESYKEFLYEFERFPRVKRDDALDSSAYLLDMIEKWGHALAEKELPDYQERKVYKGRGRAGY